MTHHFEPEYVVYCVGDTQAEIDRFVAGAKISHIDHKWLEGRYDEKNETSFISPIGEWPKIAGYVRDQDSVLLLGPADGLGKRPAELRWLKYGGHDDVDLGTWRQVTREYALDQPAYTYDRDTGAYYVADHGTASYFSVPREKQAEVLTNV